MNNIDERQKRITINLFVGLIVVIGLALMIAGLVISNIGGDIAESALGTTFIGIGSLLSPTTLLGVVIKLFINRKHLLKMENKAQELGLSKKPIQVEVKETKNVKKIFSKNGIDYMLNERDNSIVIVNVQNKTKIELSATLERDFIDVVEIIKKTN